ncbi:MAG: vWA domain-containing protein, partial [Oscillospiraceae bacterium]
TTFLQSVADSARTDQLDHRVAVVGFADGPYDFSNTVLLSTDQPVPYNSAKDADYQDALVPANVAQAVNPRLTAAVSRLATEGSTHPEYGLELAEEILRCTKTPNPQNRNRVVILLTDGYPSGGYWDDFGYAAADRAIAQSKTIKTTYGATVYTVGLFSAANPAASIDDGYSYGGQTPAKTAVAANRFMHLVSSNYPQASSMSLPGTRPDTSGSYYLSAGEEAALGDIFAQIGDQIQTPVSHVDLTATAVLRDVLSPSFVFPSGTTAEDILVSRVPYAGSGTWGAPVPYPCTVTVEGSTVSVSGFDYSASENAVFDEPGPSPTYGGNKLVVTLFAQRASFGGNGVPTNNAPGQTSGIYAEGALMEPFPVPTADLPIQLTVAAQDGSIYLGSQPDFGALLDRTKSDLPNGTNNAYVTLVYALHQGETMVASCTVPPGESMTDWSSPATFTPKTCAD